MATSTSLILVAGGMAATDQLLNGGNDPNKMIVIGVGTVAAALVAAGLDKVIPGLGTGTAVVLLMAVLLDAGPRIADKINITGVKTQQPSTSSGIWT